MIDINQQLCCVRNTTSVCFNGAGLVWPHARFSRRSSRPLSTGKHDTSLRDAKEIIVARVAALTAHTLASSVNSWGSRSQPPHGSVLFLHSYPYNATQLRVRCDFLVLVQDMHSYASDGEPLATLLWHGRNPAKSCISTARSGRPQVARIAPVTRRADAIGATSSRSAHSV